MSSIVFNCGATMKKILVFPLVLCFAFNLFAQEKSEIEMNQFTGNLKYDSKELTNNSVSSSQSIEFSGGAKKNPMLAGLFSLLLPGAGEFYTGNYWKAAAFLAAEVAIVTTAIIYDKKGDDQTKVFENYADQNWSVVKYAEWLLQHRSSLGVPDNYNITIDYANTSLPPWERVNWQEINAYESNISIGGHNPFTHKLEVHGHQQYYEMIGKYHQFSPGWSDFNSSEFDYTKRSFFFDSYSDMRGKANDYYNVATKAVVVIYVNHFLSTVDAIWSAVLHNKDIAMNVRLQQNNFAGHYDYVPTMNLRMSF